ncbi:hypothetical protein BC937DRAFT_93303, partial [Endogone sp. FLAS-F59071]
QWQQAQNRKLALRPTRVLFPPHAGIDNNALASQLIIVIDNDTHAIRAEDGAGLCLYGLLQGGSLQFNEDMVGLDLRNRQVRDGNIMNIG